MNITAIVMASGYSRRMGENKLLLTYKGKTFVQHTVEMVRKCDFYSRVIVARDENILRLAQDLSFKAIKNQYATRGQSESIKLGLNNSPVSDGYMFFTADQPLLDVETIKLLVDAFEKNKNCITIPKFRDRRGSPVIFPAKFLKELKELQGDTGGKQVINNHRDAIMFVEVNKEEVLVDVDTWEEYNHLK